MFGAFPSSGSGFGEPAFDARFLSRAGGRLGGARASYERYHQSKLANLLFTAALHDRLVAALRRRRPDALAAAEADLARPTTLWGRLTAEPDLVATGVAPKRARVDDGAGGGFSFGFG